MTKDFIDNLDRTPRTLLYLCLSLGAFFPGIIIATDEIILPKDVEVILPLLQLSRGSYRIILEIDGVYYVGEFDVE